MNKVLESRITLSHFLFSQQLKQSRDGVSSYIVLFSTRPVNLSPFFGRFSFDLLQQFLLIGVGGKKRFNIFSLDRG